MDGIFYSKDKIINKFEYWQKYDPFKRLYEDVFFKICLKKGQKTYLQPISPSKDFIESTELFENTELVICKLRVRKILSDNTKTNKVKANEIIELLTSYPLASILVDMEEHFNNMSSNTYLTSEFIDDMKAIIKGLDKPLHDVIFTEDDATMSLLKYYDEKHKGEINDVI